MTTALQVHTSALVTPDFRLLSFDPFNDFISLNATVATLSHSAEDLTARNRYIQDTVTKDQIWDSSLWKNISALECAEYNVLQTERSTLLIVINETLEQIYSTQDPRLLPYRSPIYSNLLPAFLQYRLYPVYDTVEKDWASVNKWHTRISYCLSRKVPGRSRLQIHLWLLFTVTILNAVKLGCLLSTFKEQQGSPLVTTGDAIASFLTSPCVHSAGMCLLSQDDLVRELKRKRGDNEFGATPTNRRFKVRRTRYYHAVSFSRWIVYVSSYEHS